MEKKIPYKIYLAENEIPTQWYNVRADMKNKPAPLLNPSTGEPLGVDELKPIFCEELCRQELDNDTAYFDIPEEILSFYKMYRPSPLVRAYCLEEKLGTPAKIYYKFEGSGPDSLQAELKACADMVDMLDAKMFSLNQSILETRKAQEDETEPKE